MNEHASFVVIAYAISFLTIGGVALRIVLDYRRLGEALARFNESARVAAGDDAGAASIKRRRRVRRCAFCRSFFLRCWPRCFSCACSPATQHACLLR